MSEHGDPKYHARILNPSEMSEEDRKALERARQIISEREEPPITTLSDIPKEDRSTVEEAWKKTREREERIRTLSETPDADLSVLSEDDRMAVERKRRTKAEREAVQKAQKQEVERAWTSVADAYASDRSHDAGIIDMNEIRRKMDQDERQRVAQEPTVVIRSAKPPQGGLKGFFKRLFGGK